MSDPRMLVADLAADPMYQLSTAGQELFHTNMLYWLATQRPTESTPVWHHLGIDAPPTHGPDGPGPIRREWLNIDLYVDTGMPGKKLVLENKVLAIATKQQLENYYARFLRNKHLALTVPVTEWRLLTLLPPTFQLPEPWVPVTYEELLPALDETASRMSTTTDRELMAAYARLVRSLVKLSNSLDIRENLDEPVELDAALTDDLRQARLLSLVRKLRISRCAEILGEQLNESVPGAPTLGTALTNTEGLMDFFTPSDRGRHFGWQIQGGQVRLVMLTGGRDPKGVAGRNRVASEHRNYFEFDLPEEMSALLKPYSGKKDWLGFGHQFVYRYQTLRPDVTWRQVIDLATMLSQRSVAYAQHRSI